MNTTKQIICLISLALLSFSCDKKAAIDISSGNSDYKTKNLEINDSISSAAYQQIEGKKFIREAEINLEVKDVYKTSILIEKELIKLNGFVTKSEITNSIIYEHNYIISDEKSVIIRESQMENKMNLNIPTEYLTEFIQFINQNKVFLNYQKITAEDISASIKYAELEQKRIKNTNNNAEKLKNTNQKVKILNNNESENNLQILNNLNVEDRLKYTSISVFIKEPNIKITEIPIINNKNISQKYEHNFFYEVKNSIIGGYYLLQDICIFMVSIWPILITLIILLYLYKIYKRRKNKV